MAKKESNMIIRCMVKSIQEKFRSKFSVTGFALTPENIDTLYKIVSEVARNYDYKVEDWGKTNFSETTGILSFLISLSPDIDDFDIVSNMEMGFFESKNTKKMKKVLHYSIPYYLFSVN